VYLLAGMKPKKYGCRLAIYSSSRYLMASFYLPPMFLI